MKSKLVKNTEIGLLPVDWKVKKLKDCLTIKGRIGWKGLKRSEFGNKGIVIINGPNIINGKIDWKNCLRVPKWRHDESQEISVKENDILMTKDGTIGKTAFIKNLAEPATLASGIFLIRSIDDTLDENFLYQYFNSIFFKNLVRNRIEGSVIPHLYQRDIQQLLIPIPSYLEQQKISTILLNLENKIETLQNQNKILEQIAQSLFKHWFIDFEFPIENGKSYKSSGGKMTKSEQGQIPKEWKNSNLDKIAIFLNGLPLQKFRPTNESFLPVIKIREMKNGISKHCEKANSHIKKEYIVNNGDILFSWSGSLELTIWGFGSGALNQHIFKVTSLTYEKWFFYMWIKHHLDEFRRIANDKTTTMGHIQRYHLSEALVLVPDSSTIKKMNNVVKPIFKQLTQNKVFVQNLIQIRDILVPKLMSGKIRVNLDTGK